MILGKWLEINASDKDDPSFAQMGFIIGFVFLFLPGFLMSNKMAWLVAFTHIKLLEWLLNRPVVVPLKF